MNFKLLTKTICICLIGACMIACNDNKNRFTVNGVVEDAEGSKLYIECRGIAETSVLDSVILGKDGKYSFKQSNLGYPEFYRLNLDSSQYIDFVIDSTETITINSKGKTFASNYSIEGSQGSQLMKDVMFAQHKLSKSLKQLETEHNNKVISDTEYADKFTEALAEYKTFAQNVILTTHNNSAAYFALFQKVDDLLIFNPYEKKDLSLFRAVATMWDQEYKGSPRAEHLKNYTLNILAQIKEAKNQGELADKLIQMDNTKESDEFFVINLPNLKNEMISTSSLKGKVVVLDFTSYQEKHSPARNILINNIYKKNKGKLEVYQVSFDQDRHLWANTAANLPWITVKDNMGVNSKLIARFNITDLPTTFILNKKGEVVERLLPGDDLETKLSKYY